MGAWSRIRILQKEKLLRGGHNNHMQRYIGRKEEKIEASGEEHLLGRKSCCPLGDSGNFDVSNEEG